MLCAQAASGHTFGYSRLEYDGCRDMITTSELDANVTHLRITFGVCCCAIVGIYGVLMTLKHRRTKSLGLATILTVGVSYDNIEIKLAVSGGGMFRSSNNSASSLCGSGKSLQPHVS